MLGEELLFLSFYLNATCTEDMYITTEFEYEKGDPRLAKSVKYKVMAREQQAVIDRITATYILSNLRYAIKVLFSASTYHWLTKHSQLQVKDDEFFHEVKTEAARPSGSGTPKLKSGDRGVAAG